VRVARETAAKRAGHSLIGTHHAVAKNRTRAASGSNPRCSQTETKLYTPHSAVMRAQLTSRAHCRQQEDCWCVRHSCRCARASSKTATNSCPAGRSRTEVRGSLSGRSSSETNCLSLRCCLSQCPPLGSLSSPLPSITLGHFFDY